MKSLTAAPIQKVSAGALGGAFAVIIIFILTTYVHVDMPASLTDAITLAVTAFTAYLVPPSKNDVPVSSIAVADATTIASNIATELAAEIAKDIAPTTAPVTPPIVATSTAVAVAPTIPDSTNG